MRQSEKAIRSLLQHTDITINGSNPWDMQVHDSRTYDAIIQHGLVGLGESYMNSWWDSPKLDEMLFRGIRARLDRRISENGSTFLQIMLAKFNLLKIIITNQQNKNKALEVGERHYDIGNDLYQAMLDSEMSYTCGYWKTATTLDEAQIAKCKLVCDKLSLKPGMKILDIGCGWGSLAKFAAQNYGVEVVGITISKNQMQLAQQACAGLPIEIRFQDYRDVNETFDAIVSLGMFEHVGYKNYQTYMQIAHKSLKDGGLFLLHTIGDNISTKSTNAWIEKYIFPNSVLPSIKQIGAATENCFVMEDWHNFGVDYDKTLLAWHNNFNQAWPTLKNNYSERFKRMWNYYLLSSAASFRARYIQLWQIVLSKDGLLGGYTPVR